MLFLILSFICSAILILLFKVFERNGVPIFQAIVFNYCTAATCGFIFCLTIARLPAALFEPGLVSRFCCIGGYVYNGFQFNQLNCCQFGVSTASVASKLGLVFPVLLAFGIYHESFDAMKLVGILLGFRCRGAVKYKR